MNPDAAKIIIEKFVTGSLDALEALLGLSFVSEIADGDLPASGVGPAAEEHAVWMRSKIAGGGAVALLWRMQDAARILSLSSGGEAAKETLEDSDADPMREIAETVLGGGRAHLAEVIGEDFALEGVETVWGQAGSDLSEFIGEAATGARIAFKAEPQFDATMVLVYSESIEARIPGEAAGDAAVVTGEEVEDILSGFTPDDEPDRAAGPTGPTGALPENLDVILNIELIATARLGKVEVPISEILSLSPGSIIEVGHLVDEPVELLVNDKLIARGDVVVVDERFGLRITEIISQQERIETLR